MEVVRVTGILEVDLGVDGVYSREISLDCSVDVSLRL